MTPAETPIPLTGDGRPPFAALAAEARFAMAVVSDAARLARRLQGEIGAASLIKSDRSPVTVADFSIQALVTCRLADAFPDDRLVAEETASALRRPEGREIVGHVTACLRPFLADVTPDRVCTWIDRSSVAPPGRYWVLDPIDGTRGFLRGDQFAIALALVEHHEVRLAVLGCPSLTAASRLECGGEGSVLVAVRGQGAWTMPGDGAGAVARLHVSAAADPRTARVLRSVEDGHTNVAQMAEFVRAFGSEAEPVLVDSQVKYAMLASGAGDLVVRFLSPRQPDYRERIWDQAPGSLIVSEAGGCLTDLDGRPLDFSTGSTLTRNRGVLATNGHLHAAALRAVRNSTHSAD